MFTNLSPVADGLLIAFPKFFKRAVETRPGKCRVDGKTILKTPCAKATPVKAKTTQIACDPSVETPKEPEWEGQWRSLRYL